MPVNAESFFAGEIELTIEERPLNPEKRSVFSAGKTEAVDLYHFGMKKVTTLVKSVAPITNMTNGLFLFAITERNSINTSATGFTVTLGSEDPASGS